MWRKLYFVTILLILMLFGTYYLTHPNWNVRDLANFISLIIIGIGAYAFLFQKKIFNQLFWKYIFFFASIDTLLSLIQSYLIKDNYLLNVIYKSNIFNDTPAKIEDKFTCIFCTGVMLILLSTYYMFYRLGYPRQAKKGSN